MEIKVGVLYKEIIDAIRLLPLEQQAKIYNAIFDYQFTGQISDDDAFVKSFILSHKTNFDNMKSRREINTKNGKLGGAKKGNQNARKKKSIDNYEEKQPKQPKTTENEQKQPNDNQKQPTNNLKQETRNKKQEVKNKNIKEKEIKEKETQTKQLSAPVEVVKPLNSQQRVYEYFASKYLKLTGIKYLSKRSDFISLSDLIHRYGEDMVKQKIDWLEIGCVNRVFWFAKDSGVNSFSIGKLKSQWNEILPQLTEEQRRQKEEQEKEERIKQQVFENLRKRKEEENAVSNRRTKAISID